MSARIPPGYAEAVWRLELTGDPEPMIFAWGVDMAPGEGADLANTNAILNAGVPWLADLVSSVYTVFPGWVTFGQDGPDDIRIDGTGASDAGDLGATALPQNARNYLQRRTRLRQVRCCRHRPM